MAITAVVNDPPLASFAKAAGYNHFNPGNGDAYTYDISVAMTAGGEPFTRLLQAKSRSAVLAATPLWLGAQAGTVTGTIATGGETLIWVPDGTYSVASATFALAAQPAGGLLDLDGDDIGPSNFPFVPMTGSEIGGVPSYLGALNVVNNESQVNSLALVAISSAPNGVQTISGSSPSETDGVTCDGAGNVEIDLLEAGLGNVVITAGVTRLRLVGQTTEADQIAAGNAAAILIVVLDATNLAQIDLERANLRKVVLAIKKPGVGAGTLVNFPQAGTGAWRIVLTVENTPVTFQTTWWRARHHRRYSDGSSCWPSPEAH